MIFKISFLVLLLFFGCGSQEEKTTQIEQGLVVDLQYPQSFMVLSPSGKKKFEEEVAFYQFTFRGNFTQKETDPIDRKGSPRCTFNDIPFDEKLVIHVEALNNDKQRVCHGEQEVRYVSGILASVRIPLDCP